MKVIIPSLLTTFLASCDYFNDTRVCNQTDMEIKMKLTFDSSVVNNWSGGALAENLTNTFRNWGENLVLLDIDTINYISTYLIKPDSCGGIEGGNNRRPHFHFYKGIEVISETDTLRLSTKDEMRTAFDADRSDPKYYFDLLILADGRNASR